MTAIVIFALDGVLQSESGRPIEAGCRLYRTLRGALAYHIGVIAIDQEGAVRRFFDHQHMPAPTFIRWSLLPDPFEWTAACNSIRRAYPYDIDAIITPSPDVAAALYHDGFPTVLWTSPRYARPEWRPDATPAGTSPWADFAQDLADDKQLAGTDDRITPR